MTEWRHTHTHQAGLAIGWHNEGCDVMSHMWMSHVAYMNESCLTYECVTWLIHIYHTHTNQAGLVIGRHNQGCGKVCFESWIQSTGLAPFFLYRYNSTFFVCVDTYGLQPHIRLYEFNSGLFCPPPQFSVSVNMERNRREGEKERKTEKTKEREKREKEKSRQREKERKKERKKETEEIWQPESAGLFWSSVGKVM